jgi:hypothetical protein
VNDFNSYLNQIQELIWTFEDELLCEVVCLYYGLDYLDEDKCAELIKKEKLHFGPSSFDEFKKICYRVRPDCFEILGWIKFSVKDKQIVVDKCLRSKPLQVKLKTKL